MMASRSSLSIPAIAEEVSPSPHSLKVIENDTITPPSQSVTPPLQSPTRISTPNRMSTPTIEIGRPDSARSIELKPSRSLLSPSADERGLSPPSFERGPSLLSPDQQVTPPTLFSPISDRNSPSLLRKQSHGLLTIELRPSQPPALQSRLSQTQGLQTRMSQGLLQPGGGGGTEKQVSKRGLLHKRPSQCVMAPTISQSMLTPLPPPQMLRKKSSNELNIRAVTSAKKITKKYKKRLQKKVQLEQKRFKTFYYEPVSNIQRPSQPFKDKFRDN